MTKEEIAEVIEIIPRTYNVKSIRVRTNTQKPFKAGQFLRVTLNPPSNLKRYLSISNSPTEEGFLEFTKKITASDFSQTLDKLKIGQTVFLEYPFGSFTLEKAKGKKICFLCGGIGITPVRSICKFVVDKKIDVDIVLLYANNSFRDIVFYDDFVKMQEDCQSLKIVHVLCELTDKMQHVQGRINAGVIKEYVLDYKERDFFLCGPPLMVEAMQAILEGELNVLKEKIITENFQGY